MFKKFLLVFAVLSFEAAALNLMLNSSPVNTNYINKIKTELESMNEFIFIPQREDFDCGVACIEMLAKHFNIQVTRKQIITWASYTGEGINMKNLSDAIFKMGFRTMGINISYDKLISEIPLPCIAHINEEHFVVVFDQIEDSIFIADPSKTAKELYSREDFLEVWSGNILIFEHPEK